MTYHWAIINPEVYPAMFLKELDLLCREYEEKYKGDIIKGCKRNFCAVPASSFARFINHKGFNKARSVSGYFVVDDPRPLSVDDFTDEEKGLAKSQGVNLSNPEEAWLFVQKNNLEDEMKNVPHYWTSIDKLIIDFTGHSQFVKTGMAIDNKPQRYKRKTKNKLKETLNQPYSYEWIKKDTEKGRWVAVFDTSDGGKISFEADIFDANNDSWMIEFKKNGTYKATGDGDAFRIFATVVNLIEEFVNEAKPNTLVIDSEKVKEGEKLIDGSRTKLYKVIMRKLSNSLGYKLDISNRMNYTTFVLSKPKELKETGDSYYPFKQTSNNPDFIEYNFETEDERKVGIIFSASDDDNTKWGTAFDVDGEMGISGKGDQFKILSTILKITALFIETKKPEEITFSADKIKSKIGNSQTSRSKIYKRGMDMLAKKYGYEVNINSNVVYMDTFTITKKKNKPLAEIGNSSYLFSQTANSSDFIEYKFETDDYREVTMFFTATNDDNTAWDVGFDVEGSMGITGEGDAFKILSTILKILNLFIEENQPEEFHFTADKMKQVGTEVQQNNSRASLYKKAMVIIAKKWGYTLEIDKTTPYLDLFILSKPKKEINEEVDSKELTRHIRDKIILYENKIKQATKPGEITKIIRQIATTAALEISKKYDKKMTKSRWTIVVDLINEKQHLGESATSEDGYGLLRLHVSRPFTIEFLEDLQSDSPGIVDDAFNSYWLGILRFLTHELLHIEQWIRSKGKLNNRQSMIGKLKTTDDGEVDTSGDEAYKHYLADKVEISAYSMNAVQELQSIGMNIDEVYDHIKKSKSRSFWLYLINKSISLKQYWTFFGVSDKPADKRVWNLFLKKFIYHLELRTTQ